MAKNQMIAEFLMTADRLVQVRDEDARRAGVKSKVKITPHGNGAISVACGPTQQVMFLIGAVANQGEDCLYRAQII